MAKNFPEQLLQELFIIAELKSDLMSVYAYTDLPSHLDELVRHNFVTNLHLTLPQYCKLANLALTIPLTVASSGIPWGIKGYQAFQSCPSKRT